MLLYISLIIFVMGTLTLLELRRDELRLSDRWLNLQAFGIGLAVKWLLLFLVSVNLPYSWLDGSKMPLWQSFPIYLIAMDLGEYLFHRAQHRVPWLWAMHSLHHSDPDMNATTVERHFWGDQLVRAVTIWPLVGLLIRPTPAMVLCLVIVSAWHTVVHARLNFSFGKLSWLLNSPAYHRRHHSSEPQHFNSNYSALFPIFDVLSGAYHQPDSFPSTGLPTKPRRFADLIAWPLIAPR